MGFGGASYGFGGPSSVQSNQDAGLPFAGLPGDLSERLEEVLEQEPEHPEPEVEFEYYEPPRPPFTLRTFLAPFKWALVAAFGLVILETLALQAGPLLTKIGIDNGVAEGDLGVLIAVSIAYLFFVFVHASASFGRIAFTGRLGERLMFALRVRIFSHLQRMSVGFFTEEKAGVLMTRMTSDIEALTMLVQEGLVNFAVQGLTLVVIAVILFLLNPTLAAITLLVVVPATFALTLWFRHASENGYDRVRERIANVLSDLQESLAGIRVITAHNRRKHNVIHHRNVVGEHEDANMYTATAAAAYGSSTEAIGIIGQAIVLAIGGRMVFNDELSIGELTAFALYLTAFFAPIQQLVQLYNSYQQGQAAITKLRDLLETTPSVPELHDAAQLPPIVGHIQLTDVTFGYSADTPVLTDVNLEIPAGESLAVVGPTGAGKSTIAKLIIRFYDPQSGTVSIDGHDLRDVKVESLRSQLGVVPQEAFLFHGTVRDNVAFSNPDASDADVEAACAAVGIEDLIDSLPGGIHAPVHERGSSLSAGERQLLALARAFLAKPRVLVLDEATSNLDLRSEAKIEQALDALLQGRTAIVIAHRLATAMRADRIAVVDEGGIVELGSHDELVELGGRYAEMYATWASHTGQAASRGAKK
jgi:ATP-binding cassette subfamily B protein